jgi:hypothetical protein
MAQWRINHPEDVPVELHFWRAQKAQRKKMVETRRNKIQDERRFDLVMDGQE